MKPSTRTILAVATVEFRSAVRDRRALLSALVFPLIGPILVGFMFTGLAHTFAPDERPSLTIAGGQHAPGLLRWLRGRGLIVLPAPPDAQAQVQRGELDVVVVIRPDFGAHFSRGEPAQVQIIADFARPASAAEVSRAEQLLQGYGAQIASFRLLARGVHPGVLQPIKLAHIDLASPAEHSAKLLTVIPLFVILSCFIGGMQVAIDATAGERERGSLEALLLNPVSRSHIAVGKWLVTSLFSATSALLTLVLSVVSLSWAPLEEIGVHGGIGPTQVALIALVVLPLAPLAAALQLYVATFARSFKEAQTWLSLLLFLPMIPGFVASVMPLREAPWMFAVPSLGQQLMVTTVLSGEVPAVGSMALAAGVCGVGVAVALWATGWMLRRERIIFRGQ